MKVIYRVIFYLPPFGRSLQFVFGCNIKKKEINSGIFYKFYFLIGQGGLKTRTKGCP